MTIERLYERESMRVLRRMQETTKRVAGSLEISRFKGKIHLDKIDEIRDRLNDSIAKLTSPR